MTDLEAENARLREALEPFARISRQLHPARARAADIKLKIDIALLDAARVALDGPSEGG